MHSMRSTITEAKGLAPPIRRCGIFRRARDERGTASLEAMLCLPFVFLIFALILNLGYGWVMRMKADAAARFAGTYHAHLPLDQLFFGEAPEGLRELVQQKYFPHSEPIVLHVYVSHVDVGGPIDEPLLKRILAELRWMFSGRRTVFLGVPRQVPTGTLLPSTPVEVMFDIDGNTWTHREMPLRIDTLTDGPTNAGLPPVVGEALRTIGYVLKKFFWLLGMRP